MANENIGQTLDTPTAADPYTEADNALLRLANSSTVMSVSLTRLASKYPDDRLINMALDGLQAHIAAFQELREAIRKGKN